MLDNTDDIYNRICALFNQHNASYRVIEHEPEGKTEIISQLRGNSLSQAAKALVIMVKIGKKERRYYLAVVPGNCRVNLEAVKQLCHGSYVMFASEETAQSLTHCVMGAVPPFSFHQELHLVVDPMLLENDEIVFNAGLLEKSIFVKKDFYREIAQPQISHIATKENV